MKRLFAVLALSSVLCGSLPAMTMFSGHRHHKVKRHKAPKHRHN